MWCEPIPAPICPRLHCAHKKTPGALKHHSCFAEAQTRIKELSKWKKTPSYLAETQSNKPSLSLPTVPLQDKSFCSATPNGSLLIKPHAGFSPSPSGSRAGFQLLSKKTRVAYAMGSLGAGSTAQHRTSITVRKDGAPSIWWVAPGKSCRPGHRIQTNLLCSQMLAISKVLSLRSPAIPANPGLRLD